MQNNLFAEIADSKAKIEHVTESRSKNPVSPPQTLANEYSSHIFNAKYTISLSNVEKRTEDSLMKSSYIAYEIKTTRSSDGESHSVWKRFKELYAWYYEVR